MATTLFLRETTTNGISSYRDVLIVTGPALTTGEVNTNGSTQVQWTKTVGGSVLEWISGRVPTGGFTLAGLMSFSIWVSETTNIANAGGRARVFKRLAAGSESEIGGGPYDDGVKFSAAEKMTWTGTPTSTEFAENDRIIIRYYITNIGTMGSGQTCALLYDSDAVELGVGDSFFQIFEDVTFKQELVQLTPSPVPSDALTLSDNVVVIMQVSELFGEDLAVWEEDVNLIAGLRISIFN